MIRKIISFLGYVNVASWGLIMTYTMIVQRYLPYNTAVFYFNNHGESLLEHAIGIVVLPCMLYYLYHSARNGQFSRRSIHDE